MPERRRWVVRRGRLALLAVLIGGAILGVAALVILRAGDRGTPVKRTPKAVLPAVATPDPVLGRPRGGASYPTSAGLTRALAAALADPALGSRVSMTVAAATSGEVLLDSGGSTLVTPASTAKIPTAAAALAALGERRLVTRAVAGAAPGEVILVGGGDPTLAVTASRSPRAGAARVAVLPSYPASPTLVTLATAVRRLGPVQRVLIDDTLFGGPAVAPSWSPSYVSSGNVAPISALMVDGGRVRPRSRVRSPDPALAAGTAFARLLGVPAGVARARAAPDARLLGEVSSAPVPALVERMLLDSDNVLAEALGRHVALARSEPATFGGAATAIAAQIGELGVDSAGLQLVDGSGLSRSNQLRPATLAAILAAASSPAHPELRPLLSGLPVAGYLGTLSQRYRSSGVRPAAGLVRAKTGTLNGVSTLAGVVIDAENRPLTFALAADRLPGASTRRAEAALDKVVASLARCGCR